MLDEITEVWNKNESAACLVHETGGTLQSHAAVRNGNHLARFRRSA